MIWLTGFMGCAQDQGTRVQHILYDAADAAVLNAWRAAGIVRAEQSECLLVLGRYADGAAIGTG